MVRRRLKIGLDVDDTLVDFIAAFRIEAEKVLGRTLEGPPGDWGFSKWHLSKEDVAQVWESINTTPNWFYEKVTSPLAYVMDHLTELNENHDLFFITARHPIPTLKSVREQTQHTLNDLGVERPVVLVDHFKGFLAYTLKLDVFFDDRIENLIDVGVYGRDNTKLFLMNRSHNEGVHIPVEYHRVNNFREFVEEIRKIE